MSMLTELGDYLETAGVGIQPPDADANLYLGTRPDDPDTVLVLYQYAGGDPEYVQDSPGPIAEYPQLQVVARAVRPEDAEALAYRAWSVLAALRNATLGTTRYRAVRPNSSPADMGRRDSNDRTLFFFNATVDKEVSIAPIS